jgi:LmbE family N-acetylglucosaminyl deacetylase
VVLTGTLSLGAIAPPVLVVAPHPDDESLHCGGVIARLRRASKTVIVVFVSDGGASHVRSRLYPPERLAEIREAEAAAALDRLGVRRDAAVFWRVPDAAVPDQGEPGFDRLVARAAELLRTGRISTVLAPWRDDPHRDHRAASAIFRAALDRSIAKPRLLEYPGWTGVLPGSRPPPRSKRPRRWTVDISSATATKRHAVDRHRSQLGRVVSDDPDGFVLTRRLRRRFERVSEIFWEQIR